jgi:drug/metabolite transporter (DMT)-like permease
MKNRPNYDHLTSGPLLALSSALLFGASTPIAKLLLGVTDPLLLAGLLYLGSGVGLALVTAAGHSLGLVRPEAPLRAREVPWLAAIVLFGGILGPALLMSGLTLTPASSGALLLNTEGLATMAIAWIVFRENVDRRIFLGAMAILAGAVLLSWPEGGITNPQLDWGSVLIVLACIAWGIDNNLTRKLSAADPLQIAMIKGLAAGAVNLALALARGAPLPGDTPLAAAAAVGFLGYGVSLMLFVLGLRHLGAARTGAYFSTAPFIGAALALPLFGEPPTFPSSERRCSWASVSICTWPRRMNTSTCMSRSSMSTGTCMTPTTNTSMRRAILPASLIATRTGTHGSCISIRITLICTTATNTSTHEAAICQSTGPASSHRLTLLKPDQQSRRLIGYRPAAPISGWISMRSNRRSSTRRKRSMPIFMPVCPAAGCAR